MVRVASGLVVLLVLLGATACGDGSGAGVAALTTQLKTVDAAAVADDPEQLQSAVGNLLSVVDDAEAAGDVSAAHADRIRTAAEALLEAAAPTDRRSPQPPKESASPPPEEDAGEDGAGEDDTPRPERGGPTDKDKGKGKAKGHDKDD